jgi:hypothetical protein
MRLASSVVLAAALGGCVTPRVDDPATQLPRICASDFPSLNGEAAATRSQGREWSLVSHRPIDPKLEPDNGYAAAVCWSAENCSEYWLRNSAGTVRYCVTNLCNARTVEFRLNEDNWELSPVIVTDCTEHPSAPHNNKLQRPGAR